MENNKAVQSILSLFSQQDGHLMINGQTCESIAQQIGTPFYAYDLAVAQKKITQLRRALPESIQIHYAIKSNPHPDVISFFKSCADGFDVASQGELDRAIQLGGDPEKIGFAGPGKRISELARACQVGIGSLNAESVTELERANTVASEQEKKMNVSLRVNPGYELVGSGMRMGGGPKQFGIDQEAIPSVLERFSGWPHLAFKGFHIFAGSQNLNPDIIAASFEKAADALISFLPHCPSDPGMVNLGGGFGIPYLKNDEPLDIEAVGRLIRPSFMRIKDRLPNIEIIVESGRYLVGECGIYVSRITDIKVSRGETFLIIDGGMHHHLAASGNFGQVIKRNFPVILPEKLDRPLAQTANVVGPLCTPLDRLGTKVRLPEVRIEDLVAVLASGAYGCTASPLGFLSHPAPIETVV